MQLEQGGTPTGRLDSRLFATGVTEEHRGIQSGLFRLSSQALAYFHDTYTA